jgi:hypothetical protein
LEDAARKRVELSTGEIRPLSVEVRIFGGNAIPDALQKSLQKQKKIEAKP